MASIAGTGVPVAAYTLCPRCHMKWQFVAFSPETAYFCSGCEWSMTFGVGGSPVNTNASLTAGTSTALSFASGGTAFALGNVLYINDGASSEIVIVNGAVSATTVPVADIDFNHNTGVAVSVAVATPTLSSVQAVPNAAGWGF